MLGVVFLLIPGGFGLLIWNSYRSQRRRAQGGDEFVPTSGARRWDDAGVE